MARDRVKNRPHKVMAAEVEETGDTELRERRTLEHNRVKKFVLILDNNTLAGVFDTIEEATAAVSEDAASAVVFAGRMLVLK